MAGVGLRPGDGGGAADPDRHSFAAAVLLAAVQQNLFNHDSALFAAKIKSF